MCQTKSFIQIRLLSESIRVVKCGVVLQQHSLRAKESTEVNRTWQLSVWKHFPILKGNTQLSSASDEEEGRRRHEAETGSQEAAKGSAFTAGIKVGCYQRGAPMHLKLQKEFYHHLKL